MIVEFVVRINVSNPESTMCVNHTYVNGSARLFLNRVKSNIKIGQFNFLAGLEMTRVVFYGLVTAAIAAAQTAKYRISKFQKPTSKIN